MQRKFIARTLLLLLVASTLGACSKKESTTSSAKATDAVIAEVNGVKITADQFKDELANLPAQYQIIAQSPEGRKELLDSMVVRVLLLKEARKDGIDKTPEVERRLASVSDRIIAEAYLKKKLEQVAQPSDEELKKLYDQYKDKFKHGDQVKASHILVKSKEDAEKILDQLKKGAPFDETARKNSTDPAAAKGGDLGWFGRDAMVPQFTSAAFSLKEGELSGIVKTDYGFHIIKVTGKRPAGVLSFDEVKPQLKTAILPSKQQEEFKKMKDDLKKGAKISINEDGLKGISATPGDAPKH